MRLVRQRSHQPFPYFLKESKDVFGGSLGVPL